MHSPRPSSPSHRRRPSITANPMAWLSRSSTAQPSVSAMKISQPHLIHDIYAPVTATANVHPRYGALGSGATIVRTPRDALACLPLPIPSVHDNPGAADDDTSSYEDDPEPASPVSPSLPPYPPSKSSSPSFPLAQLPKSPPLPALPRSCDRTPPQPLFSPVLLDALPDILLDPASLIITLETSTNALRTTYATLTSRPSHLADYLQSLVQASRERERRIFRDTLVEEDEELAEQDNSDSDGHRLSPTAPFTSLLNSHLTTSGLIPHSPGTIRLFLDRPSAPYTHIVAHLRTPTEYVSLPNALTFRDRLEDLLDVRDEAAYLGLDDLHRLCCTAIVMRNGRVRGSAGSTTSSGSGQSIIHDPANQRGRDADLRLRAVPRHHPTHERGSVAARSEVGHVESAPASVRAPTPSVLTRKRSASTTRPAGDWI